MARRKPVEVRFTERFVHDPEAVEQGLKAWVTFLHAALERRRAGDLTEHAAAPPGDLRRPEL